MDTSENSQCHSDEQTSYQPETKMIDIKADEILDYKEQK
jgi:hypothetical protein